MLTAGATFRKFGVIPRYSPLTPSVLMMVLNTLDMVSFELKASGPIRAKKQIKLLLKYTKKCIKSIHQSALFVLILKLTYFPKF